MFSEPKKRRVAILGGGYAGMAAAVELAAAGVAVTVFEAGKALGGRARRVVLEGHRLDNGQHLIIGAYTELQRLMCQVGQRPEKLFLRRSLEWVVEPNFSLRCPRLPAPLHLLMGLLLARGLGVMDKVYLAKALRSAEKTNWRLATDCTAERWLERHQQSARLISRFWQPLIVGALNTPLEIASAQVLLNVLRDSLGGERDASDCLFPREDFSSLFPEAAQRFIQARMGSVRLGVMVKSVQKDAQGWRINDGGEFFDAVVCALPPHRAGMVLTSMPALAALTTQLSGWVYQPIVTIYLQYDPSIRLPRPMTGLTQAMSQWVFDRSYTHATPGMMAVVISAEGEHQQLSRIDLMQVIEHELHTRLGLPEKAQWRGMIAEKLATFAATANMARPPNRTGLSGLWLAGDYTAGHPHDYPATLEGAVRSGVTAARGILETTI